MTVSGTADIPGRVPVALYIATSDPESADLLTDYCDQYATARDRGVVEAVTDADRQAPLTSRPGWTRVLTLLSDRAVYGIVTYSPPMIAAPFVGFEAVRDLLRDRGAFLSVARSPDSTVPVPQRRTAGDLARRRDLADGASGYQGHGAAWGTVIPS
ncbi:hypothetical protein ACWEKM_19135 [Streptomyces sp. NPDC004752]